MLQAILVPLDGSPAAEEALPAAIGLARRSGAAVHLVHVHPEDRADGPDDPAGGHGASLAPESEPMRSYLQALRERVAAAHDGAVTAALLHGAITERLAEAADAGDLVVMTCHGAAGPVRGDLGRVVRALICRSPVPLLVVRPGVTPPAADPLARCRRILIPLDGSALAEGVFEPARILGRLLDAEFSLLRVVPERPRPGKDSDDLDRLRQAAERDLEAAADSLRALGHVVRTRLCRGLLPATAILTEIEQHPVDLIAVATHGRSGLTRQVMGSVADKIARGATVPVLLHRPFGESCDEDDEGDGEGA
jgi:nucleotide-binding universal stress UspA family protein